MPVSVQWDNAEHSILRWTFLGRWTWDDYFVCCVSIRREMLRVNHAIDVILDLNDSGRIPSASFTAARETLMRVQKHIDTIVIVATNPMIRSLYEVFRKLNQEVMRQSNITLHLVQSLDDAYALVNQQASQP